MRNQETTSAEPQDQDGGGLQDLVALERTLGHLEAAHNLLALDNNETTGAAQAVIQRRYHHVEQSRNTLLEHATQTKDASGGDAYPITAGVITGIQHDILDRLEQHGLIDQEDDGQVMTEEIHNVLTSALSQLPRVRVEDRGPRVVTLDELQPGDFIAIHRGPRNSNGAMAIFQFAEGDSIRLQERSRLQVARTWTWTLNGDETIILLERRAKGGGTQ